MAAAINIYNTKSATVMVALGTFLLEALILLVLLVRK